MRTKEEGGCKVKGTGAMRAKSTHRVAEGTVQLGIRGKERVLWEKREQEEEAERMQGNRRGK